MPASPPLPDRAGRIARLASEMLTALRFYTRLPLPPLAIETTYPPEPFGRALRWAPLAGVAVGLVGGAVLALSNALGLPALVAAVVALAATVVATGGLHEDGLADVADGFGGGATPERKLAIMRDSRLGTYGALAVGLSLLARAAAIEAFLVRGGLEVAVVAVTASAAASRGIGLLPLALLSPARADGLARGAGRLRVDELSIGLALSVGIGLGVPLLTGSGFGRAALALALAFGAAAGISDLARRQIGGVTGDVAGAAQQLCEMAILLGLLIGASPG